jgi:hypothetical protein
MHFSFKLLRIKGHYVFRAILGHPQETLYKRCLVYCVRIMSVGSGTVAVKLQPCHSQLTLYARNIPNAVCAAPPEDEQVMLETCRVPLILNKLNEKCITLVSLYWWYYVARSERLEVWISVLRSQFFHNTYMSRHILGHYQFGYINIYL